MSLWGNSLVICSEKWSLDKGQKRGYGKFLVCFKRDGSFKIIIFHYYVAAE